MGQGKGLRLSNRRRYGRRRSGIRDRDREFDNEWGLLKDQAISRKAMNRVIISAAVILIIAGCACPSVKSRLVRSGKHTHSGMSGPRNDAAAFTLIELLFVIAIIGILAAMLIPTLIKAKSKAQGINWMNNTPQLGYACFMYASDNNERAGGSRGAPGISPL